MAWAPCKTPSPDGVHDRLLLLSVFLGPRHSGDGRGEPRAEQRLACWCSALSSVATIFIAALPVLSYLLFRHRAKRLMPKVRDWMNTNSWLVNIIVYVVFILLILF